MESDFSPLESAISYKFLMFQKIPYRERLLGWLFAFLKLFSSKGLYFEILCPWISERYFKT